MEAKMSDQDEDPTPDTGDADKPDKGPIKPPTKDDPPEGGEDKSGVAGK